VRWHGFLLASTDLVAFASRRLGCVLAIDSNGRTTGLQTHIVTMESVSLCVRMNLAAFLAFEARLRMAGLARKRLTGTGTRHVRDWANFTAPNRHYREQH
jgi:hypothetical protein